MLPYDYRPKLDVLMGRGEWFKENNAFFRNEVQEHYQAYAQSRKPQDKRKIAHDVINKIHARGGRFLDVDGSVLTTEKTFMKVMKALKDRKRKGIKHLSTKAQPSSKHEDSHKESETQAPSKPRKRSKVQRLLASQEKPKAENVVPPQLLHTRVVSCTSVTHFTEPVSSCDSSQMDFDPQNAQFCSKDEPVPESPVFNETPVSVPSMPIPSTMPVSPETSQSDIQINYDSDDDISPIPFHPEENQTKGMNSLPFEFNHHGCNEIATSDNDLHSKHDVLFAPMSLKSLIPRRTGLAMPPPFVFDHQFDNWSVEPISSAAHPSDPIWQETLEHLNDFL